MRKIEYKNGDTIGNCIYIKEANRKHKYNRRCFFKCICGKYYIAQIGNVKLGHTTSCGCLSSRYKKIGFKHGLRNHVIYNRWNSIKNRCYNKNHPRYNDWGGRGIIMHEVWINNFKSFYDYITRLPKYSESKLNGNNGITIDRIDNNGNYEPGNIKWSTTEEQNWNKRKHQKL